MAEVRDTRALFSKGNVEQWNYVLTIYKEAVKLKAQQKNKKPEELLKLDNWYQEDLPSLIGSRKEKHVTHDELVMIMKWKLARGKFYPQVQNLVKINTPRMVLQASKKAYKKLPNLTQAIQSLTTLKGVGPSMASAVLAAGAPDIAPFMADECLLSIPDVDSLDYTVQEYLKFTSKIQSVADRLNKSDKNGGGTWSPHRVELALWAHYVASEYNPALLANMPVPKEENTQNGNENKEHETPADETDNQEPKGIVSETTDGVTKTEDDEVSRDGDENGSAEPDTVTPPTSGGEEKTDTSNDGATGTDENTNSSTDEPSSKKLKLGDE